MKMIEMQRTIDEQGQLIVPARLLRDMGLVRGDTVKLACISGSADSIRNTFKELVLTTDVITTLEDDEDAELSLPHELLEAAGIPVDSDLEIVCAKGAVVILEADLLDSLPDDLRKLFADLGIHPDTVREVMRNGGVFDGR
ncbi:MAG: AbrB/MazE/SpoVT family DNA-binding domain-containing protein [Firmicutes bacterium]|nr:AbrB/MazE/SpoVT family DNA-binding domain-containing protein [Bacillota bacterium]